MSRLRTRLSVPLPMVLLALTAVGCGGKKTEPPRTNTSPSAKPPSRSRATSQARNLVRLWSASGLDVPESVLYDSSRDILYVSCIDGKPGQKDGNGYIARLHLDGRISQLRWVAGLDAPKGMALWGDKLYVSDITRLRVVDVKAGKVTQSLEAPGAMFLNDVAVDSAGRVFVSDSVAGSVLVLKGDRLVPLASLKPFGGANGLLFQGKALLVGTPRGIARVDPSTGKVSMQVAVDGLDMIDGLRAAGSGRYIVSDFAGKTLMVHASGKNTVLLDTTAQKIQSADLELIPEKKLLVIPTFFHNKVIAYRLR